MKFTRIGELEIELENYENESKRLKQLLMEEINKPRINPGHY